MVALQHELAKLLELADGEGQLGHLVPLQVEELEARQKAESIGHIYKVIVRQVEPLETGELAQLGEEPPHACASAELGAVEVERGQVGTRGEATHEDRRVLCAQLVVALQAQVLQHGVAHEDPAENGSRDLADGLASVVNDREGTRATQLVDGQQVTVELEPSERDVHAHGLNQNVDPLVARKAEIKSNGERL